MTGLNTRHVVPQRAQPPVSSTKKISGELITNEVAYARLRDRRTRLMAEIRQLSQQVIGVNLELHALEEAMDWKPAPAPQETAPEVKLTPEPRGRPISKVITTSWWLRILEGAEGVKDAAHFYGTSETGIARQRVRAMNGELPESKSRDLLYELLLDGEDVTDIAELLGKPVDWVRNYQGLLTAFSIRHSRGQPVPENIKKLLEDK